jgi:hypothetical protein
MGTLQVLGLGVGGAGVVGLGVGSVFGLLTFSAWSKAKTDCGGDTTRCANVQAGQQDRNTGQTDATISTVGFIAGGALLATGAVLLLTGGHRASESSASLVVTPTVAPGQAGIALGGGF